MREALAEQLLAEVMGWTGGDVAKERPLLQAMAAMKYDDYEQFRPGMRFVESLALWLDQFEERTEKRTAYEFVKYQLVFCSAAEMSHLVSIVHPDFVRPRLIQRAATALNLREYHVRRIVSHPTFETIQRQCLFLGLSDGARIDVFRRSNSSVLTHEQIRQTYEIPEGRAGKMLDELRSDLAKIGAKNASNAFFETVILLDDFSGSGRSYLREEPANNEPSEKVLKGKLASFWDYLSSDKELSRIIDQNALQVLLVLYIATPQALQHVRELASRLPDNGKDRLDIIPIQVLPESLVIAKGNGNEMEPLIENYFDQDADNDVHAQVGGSSVRYGFSRCGLPFVLHHNTPNNSIYLLWAQEPSKIRALFPRVSRHRRDS